MNDDESEFLPPSKTQRKREAHARQDIGERLVQLSEERLATLDLTEDLRRAVLEAKRVRAHGARRRQLQYIGKLMRRVEVEPILAQLEAASQGVRAEAVLLHAVERWRARLLADDAALTSFLEAYPQAHGQPLHALIRDARTEQRQGQPPKSSRALFRALRDIIAHTEQSG